MNGLFPDWPLFGAFLMASCALAVTPGPGVFYIVTRSLSQGRSAGLVSVAGVAVGNLANAVGASIGLAALFSVSESAFIVVKYVGALYLIYLGIQALRARKTIRGYTGSADVRLLRIFRDAFTVALLNPKITLFFAAFLPQFMSGGTTPLTRNLLLAALFVSIAAVTDSIYVVISGIVVRTLTRDRGFAGISRYSMGAVLIGIGVFTALAGPRSGK